MKRPTTLIALGIFCAFIACGCSAMTPGDVSRVQAASDQPYAGNVYLLRGFIGIWSFGINDIGKRIREAGIRASIPFWYADPTIRDAIFNLNGLAHKVVFDAQATISAASWTCTRKRCCRCCAERRLPRDPAATRSDRGAVQFTRT